MVLRWPAVAPLQGQREIAEGIDSNDGEDDSQSRHLAGEDGGEPGAQ